MGNKKYLLYKMFKFRLNKLFMASSRYVNNLINNLKYKCINLINYNKHIFCLPKINEIQVKNQPCNIIPEIIMITYNKVYNR